LKEETWREKKMEKAESMRMAKSRFLILDGVESDSRLLYRAGRSRLRMFVIPPSPHSLARSLMHCRPLLASCWRVSNELFQKFGWLREKLNDMSFINGLHVFKGPLSFTEELFLQSRAATKS
jgi:hypothetical protein